MRATKSAGAGANRFRRSRLIRVSHGRRSAAGRSDRNFPINQIPAINAVITMLPVKSCAIHRRGPMPLRLQGKRQRPHKIGAERQDDSQKE